MKQRREEKRKEWREEDKGKREDDVWWESRTKVFTELKVSDVVIFCLHIIIVSVVKYSFVLPVNLLHPSFKS